MPLVNFSNLDFEQVKKSLKDYLQSNSNFTDYDFEGSNLSSILDILAYNTYITSYNANMVANEVFIDSATLRENVVSLAKNIGYLPRSRRAASAVITFFVNATNISPPPATITLKKGPIVTSSSSFGSQSLVFSITEDITVPVFNGIASFDDITVYEGILLTSNFTFTSRNPNQKFILPNSGIDTNLINVMVKGNEQATSKVKYILQDNLLEINSDSKIFFLQEIEGERYEIFFGDGIFGHTLEEGNFIVIDYISSNGDMSNGADQFSFSGRLSYNRNGVEYTVTTGISLVTTISPSSGGQNIEGVESIRKFAPKIYATQNRAVTTSDYETLIPSKIYPETESISVFGGEDVIPPQYGKVFISIKPRTGDFLSNLAKENIKLRLKKYAVAGIVPEILDLKYLYVEVNSKIYYNSNLAPNSFYISGVVQNNANKYAESTELNQYGARLKYSKFLKIIDDSHESITSNITSVYIRRDLRVALNTLAEYSVGFGNEFHVKFSEGFNIKTSAFRINGILEDIYISDLPNFDRKTGSLFFFTLPTENSQNPSIIRRNVGKINYVNGVITINPVNIESGKIKDGQTIIEISAIPKSNDVVGLQDLYLQLDINNSNFETIVDDISSGLDPSASSYIVSSSYPNGNLVRSGGRSNTNSQRRDATATNPSIPNRTINPGTGSSGSSGSSY
jgi:hypothetical protein|tara:strand:+ start:844 stop:2886 length:2043 start_codon:yes stop_codon:yes gene_type:complete